MIYTYLNPCWCCVITGRRLTGISECTLNVTLYKTNKELMTVFGTEIWGRVFYPYQPKIQACEINQCKGYTAALYYVIHTECSQGSRLSSTLGLYMLVSCLNWSKNLVADTVESVTPHKMKGVRNVLNSSAMDVLYYTSPLYRSEVRIGHAGLSFPLS